MDSFIAALHPPGWTIWQTIGTGATLTVGYALGQMAISFVGDVISRARKK